MTKILYNDHENSRKSHDELATSAQFLYDGLSREVQRLVSQPSVILDWKVSRPNAGIPFYSKEELLRFMKPSRTKLLLISFWVLILWWGERLVFQKTVENCSWEYWENWPSDVAPHHLILLADPQLVDPHTYPGRPWPLSTLTIRHTDLYLLRAFSTLQDTLSPDSVYFLGDLFDGGREWNTGKDKPDEQWHGYNSRFWLKEYNRFGRIFLDPWNKPAHRGLQTARERKLIASLPGNHDLGIGNGIRLSVRERFTTFFGNGNRIDIVGNHTIVSVDTVSLSAKGQPQSETVKHDMHDAPNEEIWGLSETFLSQVKERKAIVLGRELRARVGKQENQLLNHTMCDIDDPAARVQASLSIYDSDSPDLPTILLTHVPLYRSPGTPCGPLRERWPPSRSTDESGEPLERDDANAISVSAGYQYQNVLQDDLSKELIEKIGNVAHVFSGDDHDYCEVVHHGFTSKGGGIREITVKSMSWAMGVRHPGFLMVSLWNPIDEKGNTLKEDTASRSTLQTHLCLLPDQLSIFIRYGLLLGLTLFSLVIRAVVHGLRLRNSYKTTNDDRHFSTVPPLASVNSERRDWKSSLSGSSSSNSSNEIQRNGLAPRPTAGRPRAASPAGGYGIPIGVGSDLPPSFSTLGSKDETKTYTGEDWHDTADDNKTRHADANGMRAVWREFKQSTLHVAAVALAWYAWLVYTS